MSDIKIGRVVLGNIQTNCYFLYRDGSLEGEKEAVVVDPADNGLELFNALKQQGLKVSAILLTHGHFDHILGVAKLRQLSHCKLYASEDEAELLSDEDLNQSRAFGCLCSATADVLLKDNEEFSIAGINFKMLKTPGHTAGSCCYYIEEAGILISGDTLFEGSVGRSDFPTGSASTLVQSVKERLLPLPGNTVVYPGHGGCTTIEDEAKYNPFLV